MAELNQIGIKQQNRNNIFQYLCSHPGTTKRQLMESLNLSLPTVLQHLQDMHADGFIRQSTSLSSTGGRRAAGFSVAPDARFSIGLDINMTHIACVTVNLGGEICSLRHVQCHFEKSEDYFRNISLIYEDALRECGLPPERLLGVGMSIQGIISSDGKAIEYAPIPGLTGYSTSYFTSRIPHPSVLFHDADAAAQTELWFRPNTQNAVYVSLSTNLGGAVILNNELYSCKSLHAGKLEHLTLFPGGERCYCGRQGCAETYCSVERLLQSADCDTLKEFFSKLAKHDSQCVSAWDIYTENLALLLNNIFIMYGCNIILGGYMAEFLTPYLNDIKRRCYENSIFDNSRDYIKLSACTTEPVAYGSALYFISDFISHF